MENRLNQILLIDDDFSTNYLNEVIIKRADLAQEVISVTGGQKALDHLNNALQNGKPLPNLIFLDINMPAMNGWEFLEKYKTYDEEIRQNMVVVMLTTSMNPDDKLKAECIPEVDDFMIKPLNKEKVSKILSSCFSEK